MFRLATLAVVIAVVYSYGVPQAPPPPPQYNPAPAPQYVPPPQPVYRPIPWYPVYWWNDYYWDSWESSEHDHHHHHHDEDRPSCRNLWTTCEGWLNKSQCRQADISYYYEKNCKKAVIKCNNYGRQMQLVTGDGVFLAAGTPVTKVATCNGRGGWKAETPDNRVVYFDAVRCVTMAR
ncbi:hypothetical protein Y032_0001g112 [Ancylostoma ceylanicum]|uniref:Uncharacterized protein n=1 Tax=Ancylostoma ceylanicum TaxID=53326 RepID=A0A016W2J7_9BILA|nr:hypothetical protein Y032_0001g112 [Ancylostoma ceylanicum]